MPNRVVAEVSGEASAKTRQAGPWRGSIAAQEIADELERIAFVALDDTAPILDFDGAGSRPNAYLRRQPDEGIAAEALAADD